MVKHMRFSYESVQNMPIWERRIYLDLWQKELEEQKKEYDKVKSKRK
jgi:hypothetical protein